MMCSEGEDVPFNRLEDGCFACCQKTLTMDMEYSNTYGYTEVLVYLVSYVPGFKNGADYRERIRIASSSHGFNPEQVNQAVFEQPDRKYQKSLFVPKTKIYLFSFDSQHLNLGFEASPNLFVCSEQWTT